MAELDDLLTDRVSAEAARRTAAPPPFEELRTRGLRRRRQRRAVVTGAAAAAVVATVAGVQLTGVNRVSQPIDVPGPTSTAPPTPQGRLTAAEVVDHADARLQRVVVAPGAPDTRAALWQVCHDEDCSRSSQALAVTADGFETRSETSVPGHAYPLVTPVGSDAFYLAWNDRHQLVVRSDGTTAPVRLYDAVPMGEGATVVRTPSPRGQFIRLDPASGQAHPVSVPQGLSQLESTPDGILYGATSEQVGAGSAVWSNDGGVTWQQRELPVLDHPLFGVPGSSRSGAIAVKEGSDGATLFPFLQVHRSLDGGATWETVDVRSEPLAYAGASAVLADGRLLVDVQGWSDQRIDRPSAKPVGLYVSDGLDWSSLRPVDVGAPFRTGNSDQRDYEVLGMEAGEQGVAVYARRIEAGTASSDVYVSYDTGSSWQELAVR